jgi:prevent-host-death family protein
MSKRNGTWPVAKAKAQFSALIDCALEEGPQTITRSGRKTVVVVSVEHWEQKTKRRGTLVEFFQNSPLRGSGIEIKRLKGGVREIVL